MENEHFPHSSTTSTEELRTTTTKGKRYTTPSTDIGGWHKAM